MSWLASLGDSSDDNDDSIFSHSARNYTANLLQPRKLTKSKKDKTHKSAQSESSAEIESKKPRKRKSEDIDHHSDAADSITKTNSTQMSGHHLQGEVDNTVAQHEENLIDEDPLPLSKEFIDEAISHEPILLDDEPTKDARQDDSLEDSDDEFAEMTRRVRFRERQKQQMLMQNESFGDESSNVLEPKVEIFISSDIPNTKPLRVFIRITQNIGIVREAWCERQPFSQEFAEQVYLRHRGRKIYDNSTARSLGLDIDNGVLIMRGAEGKHGVDKVHLEAITDALQLQADTLPEGAKPSKKEAEDMIRLILKARDIPDFKIRVRSTTAVSKIITSYKTKHAISEEQDVVLEFDGEELSPGDLIGNTEIFDLDQLEVHMR